MAPGIIDKPAIIFDGGCWSFRRLQETVTKMSGVMRNQYSVKLGSRVLLRMENSPWHIAALLSTLYVGAVAVECSPTMTSAEISAVIKWTSPVLQLCSGRRAADESNWLEVNDASRISAQMTTSTPDNVYAETLPTDPAVILFTSGSTGKQKACVHLHRSLVVAPDTYGSVVPLGGNDIVAGSARISFSYGLITRVFIPLCAGVTTIILEDLGAFALAEAMDKQKATCIFSTPVIYNALLDLRDSFEWASLRVCVSSGESLTVELQQA